MKGTVDLSTKMTINHQGAEWHRWTATSVLHWSTSACLITEWPLVLTVCTNAHWITFSIKLQVWNYQENHQTLPSKLSYSIYSNWSILVTNNVTNISDHSITKILRNKSTRHRIPRKHTLLHGSKKACVELLFVYEKLLSALTLCSRCTYIKMFVPNKSFASFYLIELVRVNWQ